MTLALQPVEPVQPTPYQPLVVPTLHPAFVLRGQERFVGVIERDLKRAARLAQFGWRPREAVWICWDGVNKEHEAAVCRHALQVLRAWHATGRPIAIDTETTMERATRCRLRTVSLSLQGQFEAVAVPTDANLPPHLREPLLAEVRAICADTSVAKIIHNGPFDITVLERHAVPIRGPVYDTLSAAHIVDTGLPHVLEFVAQDRLDTDPWKRHFAGLEKTGKASLTDLLYYNGRDAIAAQLILTPLLQELAETQQEHVYAHEVAVSHLARETECHGIAVDMDEVKRLVGDPLGDEESWAGEFVQKRDTCFTKIRETTGRADLNLRKPDHARWFLYDFLKLPVQKWSKIKREPSRSYKGVLDFLENPAVAQYVDWSEADADVKYIAKQVGRRVDKDGRLRPSTNPYGTVGPRWTTEPNIQNAQPKARGIFWAPPGRILVAADMEQLEYRIMACFAGCRTLLEAFAHGVDAHMLTARRVYGDATIDTADEKVRKDLRYTCKRVVYAMNYGAGAKTVTRAIREDKHTPIRIRARLTERAVAAIMAGFFRAFPEIPVWRTAVTDFANAHGYLVIPPLGRRAIFHAVPVEATKAYNYPIQWSAGEIVNMAALNVRARLPQGAFLVQHGHDSLMVECDERDGPTVAKILEECLEYRLEGPAGPVRLFAKAKSGRRYSDLN